jgi:hypothetical protein
MLESGRRERLSARCIDGQGVSLEPWKEAILFADPSARAELRMRSTETLEIFEKIGPDMRE